MGRQSLDGKKYLTVFAITTLIFIIGILVGNYFSGKKMEQIDYIGQNLKSDTIAMELQYDLIAEEPCQHVNSTPLADEMYEMAEKLDYMENRLGENNPDVKELKKQYSLLELRHWLFLKKTNKECEQNKTLILFFYSNEKDCSECKDQGFILTWARRNFEDVYVYSFDYDIDNVALKTVKEIFKIEQTPSVVIDKTTYNRFVTKEDLEEVFEEKGAKRI